MSVRYLLFLLDLNFSLVRMKRTITTVELLPNTTTVPDPTGDGGSDEDWEKWVLSVYGANDHPIGTAAMMRRELGGTSSCCPFSLLLSPVFFFLFLFRTLMFGVSVGVVDARLRVYDTTNVRVVDASVMPLQVSAHLSSPLYGIAEKAAEMIIEDSRSVVGV